MGSMSRKGNCWDNSVMQRFFLNLKMEQAWQKDYANHLAAINDVADYIVGFYNSISLHSKLGNSSSNAFKMVDAADGGVACLSIGATRRISFWHHPVEFHSELTP